MKMKQLLLATLAVLILLILLIKLVRPVNSIARGALPAALLHLIGEEPKGLLEKGLDDLRSLVR